MDIFVCTADPEIEPPTMVINTVLSKFIKSVLFRPEQPEHPVPFIKPGQNGVVFVPVIIPVRSANSSPIPAGTPRFYSGRSVPD